MNFGYDRIKNCDNRVFYAKVFMKYSIELAHKFLKIYVRNRAKLRLLNKLKQKIDLRPRDSNAT